MVLLLTAPPATAQEFTSLQAAAAIERALIETIADAEHSVVAIARVDPEEISSRDLRPDLFSRFGPSQLMPNTPAPTDPDFIPKEFSTGVVIDRRGLILTNFHVLGPPTSEYYITTTRRKVFRVKIKAGDPRIDLALLEVVDEFAEDDFVPIKLGDAGQLQKGQIVIALGNPYAIARDGQPSASWGIVSNLQRKAAPEPTDLDSRGKHTLHHFGTLIQTDARLNLGTSGGALLNLSGQMIGLTTSQAAVSGYEQAAGYAVPVDDTFLRVLEQLKRGNVAEYGLLGVRPKSLNQDEVLSGLQGVWIDEVLPGSPAARAGVERSDRVTHVNGTPVYDTDGLMLHIGKLPPSQEASLILDRGGRSFEVQVMLTKYPVRGRAVVTAPQPKWRGMQVEYPNAVDGLDPQIPFGLGDSAPCVIVSQVEQDSAAWEAGVRRGMLVTHVDNQRVEDPGDFYEHTGEKTGDVALRLLPGPSQPLRIVVPAAN